MFMFGSADMLPKIVINNHKYIDLYVCSVSFSAKRQARFESMLTHEQPVRFTIRTPCYLNSANFRKSETSEIGIRLASSV